MAKKYYGEKRSGFGMAKNDRANMPQNVVHKTYPTQGYVMQEGYYKDTQPQLDAADSRVKSKVRSSMRKNLTK